MLNRTLLKHLRDKGGKITAQCPACAEAGADRKGNHLVMYPAGPFGCVAHPADKAHLRRIAELVGDGSRASRTWHLAPTSPKHGAGDADSSALPQTLTWLSRDSVVKRSHPRPSEPSEKEKLGRSGRFFSYSTLEQQINCVSTYLEKESIDTEGIAGDRPDRPEPLDVIAAAAKAFGPATVTVLRPTDAIPPEFQEVLRSWPAVANHPAWAGTAWRPKKRQLGWARGGMKMYAQPDAKAA
jgi:hypothetical protein